MYFVVSYGEDARKWNICRRQRGRSYQDGHVLCLQGDQQETNGGEGTYGKSPVIAHSQSIERRRSYTPWTFVVAVDRRVVEVSGDV